MSVETIKLYDTDLVSRPRSSLLHNGT